VERKEKNSLPDEGKYPSTVDLLFDEFCQKLALDCPS